MASKVATAALTQSLANKEKEKEYANGYVAGGTARGGGERDSGMPEVTGTPKAGSGGPTTPPPNEAPPEGSVARQMAQGGTAGGPSVAQQEAGLQVAPPQAPQGLVGAGQMARQPGTGDGIRGLIAQRGPVSSPVGDQREGMMLANAAPGVPMAPQGRRFTGGSTQLNYQPRGLV